MTAVAAAGTGSKPPVTTSSLNRVTINFAEGAPFVFHGPGQALAAAFRTAVAASDTFEILTYTDHELEARIGFPAHLKVLSPYNEAPSHDASPDEIPSLLFFNTAHIKTFEVAVSCLSKEYCAADDGSYTKIARR